MKKSLHIEDLIEGETDDLGQQLHGVFEELRTEPEAFRRGVQQRIDTAGEEDTRGEDEYLSTARVPFLVRQAAAFFPPALLPKGAAKFGLGGTAAGNVGAKLLSGSVLLPAVSVVMILFTLFLGLKAVFTRPQAHPRQDERSAKEDTKAWWRRFWIPVVLLGCLSIWMVFNAPGDGFTLMIAISTVAFLGVCVSLVRSGLATRREVAGRAGAALFFLFGMTIQLVGSSPFPGSRLPLGWLVPLVLLTGGCVSFYLGKIKPQGLLKRRFGHRAFLGIWALGTAFILTLEFGPPSETEAGTEEIRQWLSSMESVSAVNAGNVDQTVLNLQAAGVAPLDLIALRSAARTTLDREYAEGSFNYLYAAPFIRLGCFESEDYERVSNQRRIDKVLSTAPRRVDVKHLEPALLAYLNSNELTADQRTMIANKVLASLDPSSWYANAVDVAQILFVLEALGLSERQEELGAAVDGILRATWAPTRHGDQAAFASYRSSIDRDEGGASVERRLSMVWSHPTSVSVWLMSRFGVPEWMGASDLRALDSYLAKQSRFSPRRGADTYEIEPGSARILLHTMPEWGAAEREWSLLRTLFNLRVLLAAVLMAGFSILLTLRAPVELHAAQE